MKIELLFSDGSKHPYPGKIDFVNRSVDPSTGTISVQASFPNPEQSVRPGLFAKMRMSLFIPIQSMLLPQKAIMEIQGRITFL
jgi:Membrane-fusion protein